jgi:hypothetical protein
MNKTRNTGPDPVNTLASGRTFKGFLQRLLAVKGFPFYDLFCGFANTYHEKLPIIYANIRV